MTLVPQRCSRCWLEGLSLSCCLTALRGAALPRGAATRPCGDCQQGCCLGLWRGRIAAAAAAAAAGVLAGGLALCSGLQLTALLLLLLLLLLLTESPS